MKVSELMTRDVLSCHPAEPLQRVAQIMWERDCGCVPVVDADGALQGVITDRDVAMAAYTSGQGLASLPAERAMSRGASCCAAGDEVTAALAVMQEGQLHRLPVLDASGQLVGLLSLADVIQGTAQAESRSRRKWADGVFQTLAQVTRPRGVDPEPALPARPAEPEGRTQQTKRKRAKKAKA